MLHAMRSSALFAVVLASVLAAVVASACAPGPAQVCGLSTEIPSTTDAPDGRMKADRSGASTDPFNEAGSWGAGASTSLDAGLLSLIIGQEQNTS